MMKILVLGKGFLGKAFEKDGFEVRGRDGFDIGENILTFTYQWERLRDYDVIINCIGKSNTRWCEDEKNWNEVYLSNAIVPKLLSEKCKELNKRFVHISTGCLYDRYDVAQKEDDFVVAHCKYVISKWIGEIGCDKSRDLILRPRLYFGDFEDRNNLICKIPKFESLLDVPNSFTSVHVIVEACKKLIENEQVGIFNVACDEYATLNCLGRWMGFERKKMTEKELHAQEKLYLVNNLLNIDKLKKYYQPPRIYDEWMRCVEEILSQ